MDIRALLAQQNKVDEYPAERKRRLDELFNAFSVVAEGTYVFLCDMYYDISRWTKAAVDNFDLPSEYMFDAGRLWENRIHSEDRNTYRAGIDDIFAGKTDGHDMQYRVLTSKNKYEVCTCRGVVISYHDSRNEYFVGVIRNHGLQGHMDTLTGLRNQYGFFEDLQSALNRLQQVNIALIGVNKFSEINEVYGYHFGNRVLQQYARFIFERVGNTGSVYRIDGTKIAVISSNFSVKEIIKRYALARNHFRSGFKVDDRDIILEMNGGLVPINSFDIDVQTIFACLNFAYSESKVRRQGEMVEFYNDLNEKNRYRIERLNRIRSSILHGYTGFFLMYQPVVDARDEKLIGAEALLRWSNEEFGVVPPDHFIQLLEADPLFPELGKWILKEALSAANKILERFPDFIMNVNLSYTQLEKPDFCDVVFSALKEADFPAGHLCLEITERCRLLDMELLKNTLISLKSRGVRIALDDFGTGFSSIGILKELPFDIIKIDRSFVRKIEEDDMERELMRHFASVASTFGAKVCVEGIETEGMRDILQKYHVQSFQGYYYAKPLMLEDFLNWKA